MAKKKRKFEIVGGSFEDHAEPSTKFFSHHHLNDFQPKTYPQEQFMDSYFSNIPVIFQSGSAGTGKTAIALWCSLFSVFNNDYQKIVVVRSAVQSRDMGFLPGTEDEKNLAYEQVYINLCDELLKFKSNNYNNLKAKGLLEFHNTSFLRGKTFDNSIVIVDESQNMTYAELSTCITRVGINSRIIFTGDYKQTDLVKKNDQSGYHQFMRVLDNMESSYYDIVQYTPRDILRSDLCKAFLLAEEATV